MWWKKKEAKHQDIVIYPCLKYHYQIKVPKDYIDQFKPGGRKYSKDQSPSSVYICSRYECGKCRYFGSCTESRAGREIHIYDNIKLLYQMRQKLDTADSRSIYKRRQAIVEPLFANIKHNLRFREFLLRGLKKVKAEFTLMAIVHNIQKIAKFLKKLLFSKLPRSELAPVLAT
jgi:hypothetical protein